MRAVLWTQTKETIEIDKSQSSLFQELKENIRDIKYDDMTTWKNSKFPWSLSDGIRSVVQWEANYSEGCYNYG